MKRASALLLFFLVSAIIFADQPEKFFVERYILCNENITGTINIATTKWEYIYFFNTERYINDAHISLEILLYKQGDANPLSKIILENGVAGGNRIFFDNVHLMGIEVPYQNLVAYHSSVPPEKDMPLGFRLILYEPDSIGPGKEVLDIIFKEAKD